jgi:cytosine/adenosine deaminase-related metal-dependent hydrolase
MSCSAWYPIDRERQTVGGIRYETRSAGSVRGGRDGARMKMATHLTAERILTHPGEMAPRARSSVTIEDGRISAVAPSASGGDGLLMLPALVDAHDHGRGQRSFAIGAGDQALELWLPMLALEPQVDPYLRAATAFARLACSGIAAINHCHNPQRPQALVQEAEAVARAARDVGIRVAFGVPLRDRNYAAYGDPGPIAAALGDEDFKTITQNEVRASVAEQLGWVEAIAAFEHPRFHVQFGPVGPQWCSDTLLEAIAEASARTGRRIHMHLLETRQQREWAAARYPAGLVRRLDSIGLLSERLTVAHGVWLKPDECELLAARRVTVSVNTSSNLRLGSGTAPVALFAAKGLAWAMGLDGMALDDDEDALRELRLLWHNQKSSGLADGITRAQLCAAVFTAGRHTITPVAGGRIAPGMAADLLLLDYARMATDVLAGAADELDVVLARGRKEHVVQLVVDGRTIVENGTLRSIDQSQVESELMAQARAAWPAASATTRLRVDYRTALADFYRCGCHQHAAGDRTPE